MLTSINQTAANQILNNADELGVEKFEVSAHIGSRPEHEEWQRKIFTKKGLYSICGLGSTTGLCGINCRHSFYPYFEGTKEHYTQDDLDEIASEKMEFNGEELSYYDGEQKLRGIERNIRRYKRQALTQEAVGVDNTRARQKIGEWQVAARDFTKQTGITRDSAREYVGTSGNQPRGIIPKPVAQPKPTATVTPATTDSATTKAMSALMDNPKSATRATLERLGVEAREIKAFETPLTQETIIKRIAGGDKTKGSCSSLGFSYATNKAGFDVLDFRGGNSCKIFSQKSTIEEISKLNGVKSKVLNEFNDFTASHKLYMEIEAGKEYYFVVGRHATIIQRKYGDLYWLEMQSANADYNTWHILDDDVLKHRFKCQKSHTVYKKGIKYHLS
ncbi:phage minor capsid protein [Treponema pectinovorum]|uniref:phage minor capsid protein n=1 Tax=Treponema pectinovorum TaxID=164 RepID=UPI0011F1BF26|nr:phage minor capsid protein [Treponema pectinovorum]